MQSLKQQIMILMVITILALSISFMVAVGLQIRNTAVLAAVTKAKSDLATGEAILDLKYPGPWRVKNGVLYKGDVRINNNFEPVDYISKLTGDTCTIFLGDTRVSTTVRLEKGQRAVGTHVSDEVAKRVLKSGGIYLGEAEVVGEKYQTAYKPIYDEKGKIVGMFYVGTSKQFFDDMFYGSLLTIILVGIVITVLVLAGTWYYTQRVIIAPLKLLTAETQKVAAGNISMPVNITSKNEIGELARSFNEMVGRLETLTYHISKATGGTAAPPARDDSSSLETGVRGGNNGVIAGAAEGEEWDMLPKGLNKATLLQILHFLQNKKDSLSVSEIAREINLTKVTVRRYLDYLEKCGKVKVDMQYGPVGRPLKRYQLLQSDVDIK